MAKIKYIICTYLLLFTFQLGMGQDVETLSKEAKQLESVFKDSEALVKYLQIVKIQPNNLPALCRISELYSLLGKRQAKKEDQKKFFKTGKQYAQSALAVNPNSADANFAMALAMGRMAIISSGEEKIKAVRDIKNYAEKCIQIDPQNFKAYHILGRWHYEVSNLSSLERWIVKVTYGSLPPASIKDAIKFYEKSRSIKPDLLVNYLELAKVYHAEDDDTKAVEYLKSLLKIPNNLADDPIVKTEATAMLKKLDK